MLYLVIAKMFNSILIEEIGGLNKIKYTTVGWTRVIIFI